MTGISGPQGRRGTALTLDELADRITPYLRRGSLPRSVLEGALTAIGADDAARDGAIRALVDAGIAIVEDTPDLTARVPNVSSEANLAEPGKAVERLPQRGRPTTDPLEAGRRRLSLDRWIPPSRLPLFLLTAEEEVGLTLLARPDGQALEPGGFSALEGEARQAAEALVLHNLRLAHSMARAHAGQGLEHEDLYQSALSGLIRAVERFDPTAGFKFSTYATWWLRQAVTRAIANEARLIRLPVHMWELVRKVRATRERLTVDGIPPGLVEIAEACQLEVPKVVECLRLAPGVLSLETPLGDDQFTLGDLVDATADVPEHVEVHGLFPEDVEPLLLELKPREADVLRMRLGLAPFDRTHTLDEIGGVFGVTRERIRQIESKAMTNLRRTLTRQGHPFDFSTKQKPRVMDDEAGSEAHEEDQLAESA